ncbi:transporter substrate-binding domain-containing protein [Glaciecola sp. MH2013]|uniref:transporter substrate-binding domain-containing protein n=1 Tax=Glaciecola sp. MH2013 TaxID=2785524 RepID=UPI00189D5683|nr:transporter substrate-binding domain-containing protein [Glaciecola sp. MH2013]MBF7074018.1 transporter substrate-binding domain-containing protein [Glaciecola sp. MH2013]
MTLSLVKGKYWSLRVCALFCLMLTGASTAQAESLQLVGNKVATYIDEHELPARQMDLVKAAFTESDVNITATTQAWSGSGLKSGRFKGYIDHYSLNDTKDNYLYSEPYMKVDLHVVSRDKRAEKVVRLEQMYRERVGIENRFANTDALRAERNVRWARGPSFFDTIKQLAEYRVDFLLVDKRMANEMNKLLVAAGEKPIYISKVAIISIDVSLAMNANYAGAADAITEFNNGIMLLKESSKLAEIMDEGIERPSLLDENIYDEMITRW